MPRRRPRKAEREADEIGAFVRRMVRALTRRAADGDVEALVQMVQTRRALDVEILTAARALVAFGWTYAEIGRELGISKQRAHQRFAPKPPTEAAQ